MTPGDGVPPGAGFGEEKRSGGTPAGKAVNDALRSFSKEVVYEEDDRERSLAFRLFRDGVRKITFGKKTEWEELLRLLEILSVRFTGVRQRSGEEVRRPSWTWRPRARSPAC